MFDPSKYAVKKAKPLPVLLLVDVSYSMSGSPIEEINSALKEMVEAFKNEAQLETEIVVSVITFGNEVTRCFPFTSPENITIEPLVANGMTPMGTALKMAKDMIEDKEETPSRAYRPTVVLMSDGGPNDSWEQPMSDFISSGRSAKCDRMAMAIGNGADESVLNQFIEGCEHPLFRAENASEIATFFKKVTMSVTTRSQSKTPNQVPKKEELEVNKVKSESTVSSIEDDYEDDGF